MSDEKKDNYSRDADQTRYLWIAGIIGESTLIFMFALEVIAMVKFATLNKDGSGYTPFIFTPEIVHTLIPVTVGAVLTIGSFLFGREVGKQQERRHQ